MIKNASKVNSVMSLHELQALLTRSETENAKLKNRVKDLEYEVKLG
jgi:cell division protein FtsB